MSIENAATEEDVEVCGQSCSLGSGVDFADVEQPRPGAGEVLLKVIAAGVCQTDLHIRRGVYSGIIPGRILGHEIAGRIAEVGVGVTTWKPGQLTAVYPAWSCGVCAPCQAGRRNGCLGTGDRRLTPKTPGVSVDGGMAEFLTVPANALVDIGDLDPGIAATMSDSALSPYGSISGVRELLGPGTFAVVIGVGGLGSMAVQILAATTATTVIALDVDDAAIERAGAWAAHAMRSDDPNVVDQVLGWTGGYGAQAVFDFVGIDPTLELAADTVAPFGAIRVTGMSGGTLTLLANAASRLPRGATIAPRMYSGSYPDLTEVMALARSGALQPQIVTFDFADGLKAMDELEAGGIQGRAVLRL